MQSCKVSLNTEFKVENTREARVAELKTRVAKLKTRVAELKTRVNFAWILTKKHRNDRQIAAIPYAV
jgi:hypothetical protein